MLYESQVSSAIVKFLKTEGYQIIQQLKSTQQGIDIVADNGDEILCVEVKGETSELKTSERYGKAFDANQVVSHVSRAIYASLKDNDRQLYGSKTKVAMAFPGTDEFLKRVRAVSGSLRKLDIKVFIVSADLNVSIL
jgi:Holliday junction resolvase-like predicted endonuclease